MIKNSLIILLFFAAGLLSGLFEILPDVIVENDFSNYALYLLMLFVGISVGLDTNTWSVIKNTRLKIILVPLSVIIGTLLGAGIASLCLPEINLRESLAIGSGFGYYSLSSIFISQISGKTLGVIALFSNIQREIITLIFTPLFAKHLGKLAPIASGGATSMDTTLPIITQFSGKEYAIISIFSGVVLSILVPFLIMFFLQ